MQLQQSRMSLPGLRKFGVPLLLLALFLLAACGGGEGKGKWGKGNDADVERKDPLVEVARAKQDNISSVERSTGRIEARYLADVYAQVSEVCLELLHDVGDVVRQDTVLARLDQARLQLQSQATRLARDEAQLTHRRNQLDRDKRKGDLERIEKYFDPEKPEESRVFTKEAYEAAKLEYNKAVNSVESSQLALNKAEGELGVVALQLKYTEIKAPINGVITERNLRTNELVSSGAVAFRMADLSTLEVKLDVAEASIAGINEPKRVKALDLFGLNEKVDLNTAQAVIMSVTAFPNDRFLGYVDRVSPVVDQTRGMVVVTVRILLPSRVDETEHKSLLSKLDPNSREEVIATAARVKPAPQAPEKPAEPAEKPAEKPTDTPEKSRRRGPKPAGAEPAAMDAPTRIELKPGMWVDARIATRLIEGATLVPGAALSGDAEVIWKIEPDKDNPDTGTGKVSLDRRIPTISGMWRIVETPQRA
jgi:multidrug efflux pump subunit AcrA (membrane-fusion protein)